MTDPRWVEVRSDFDDALTHFNMAARLYDADGFDAPDLEGYEARMAFMHSMQSAYTSLEKGLIRILDVLRERKPVGERWHSDLIRRVAREMPGLRPAILPPELVRAADETRKFRHVAMHSYESFERDDAAKAVAAARLIVSTIPAALESFIDKMD